MDFLKIDNIAGIVILYNPSQPNLDQLLETSKIFKSLIVVNNSPKNDLVANFFKSKSLPSNIRLHNNPDNLGIAQAMNRGSIIANDDGYSWVVTLDQDSKLTLDALTEMISFYNNQGDTKIVSLSPLIINHGIISESQKNLSGTYKELEANLTSGNLLQLEALKAVGGFKEFLFIDTVDTELALNLRSHGYKIVEVFAAVMQHSIGELTKVIIFNHTIYSDKHSPIRNYYITRNNIYMFKKWLFKYPLLTLYMVKESLIKIQIKTLLFENEKKSQAYHVLRG
jgi:rhamnosyltransferase